MARFAFAVFVVSVLAFVVLGASAKLRYPDADWVEIDLSKLRVNDDVDPGLTDHSPRPGGKDDPDNPNYTRRPILGGTDDPDNPDFSGEHGHGDLDDIPKIPDDAAAPLNCTTIEDLQRHHHHSCGRAFGYATHHCHCDWGECREHKRPHSWCGCPWGKCRQDRPKYCAFIWKYCAHHHHRPGIEPRALKPVMEYGLETTIQSSPAPTTTAPPAPTTTAPPAPTTTAPPAPTTTAPPKPTTTAPPKPTTTAPPVPTTTAPPTTAPPTTAPPATTTAHHPSHRCGPWGYTTFACICPMGSCYSRHRPHGYCGCPWGYCKNKRPDFCRYFWKHCPQPHCNVVEPEKPIIDVATSAASIPESTPRPWSTQWPWWQTTANPWWHTTKAPTNYSDWYCAVKSNGEIVAKTKDLATAQQSLGWGNPNNRQAIIPMMNMKAGDPHTLSKSWNGGSMWWWDWSDIHSMQKFCEESDGYYAGTDGHLYKFHLATTNWLDAEYACGEEGGNLAMVKTDATHHYLRATWPDASYWIGIHDRNIEGTYQYVDGTPVVTAYWADGEPNNNNGNEDCVHYNPSLGGWNDLPCSALLWKNPDGYLCQKEKSIIDVETSTKWIPENTPRWQTRAPWPPWPTTEGPWRTEKPTRVDCGKYGVASDKCKCSWYKCRFWPHRPSGECGCPWGFCREDRPSECKAETPHPHDLRPTDSPRPRPTHGHHHHDKCGRFGVATRDCRCDQGNCRADRPSEECGCPWGQCAQSRPYHCKWRGTEDHHHHHHHHGPPPHHHHHHHHHHRSSESGSSESGSSQSRSSESWEDNGSDESGEVDPNFTEDVEADKMQMILYGAMGFLICSLLFLFMTAMFSIAVKRMRRDTCTGATYRNLTTTPVEYVRNPLENVTKEPEDKEKLIPANE